MEPRKDTDASGHRDTDDKTDVGAVDEGPRVSGLRHIMRGLDALRSGTKTSLHLNADEHAAVSEHLKANPIAHEHVRSLVDRLLKGEEVNPPVPGTIPEDVQTA